MTSCRRGDTVSTVSILLEKIEEGRDCISLAGEMLDLHMALDSDPAPTARQADFAEQTRLNRQGIETSHVGGFVCTFDVELIGLNEHGSLLAHQPDSSNERYEPISPDRFIFLKFR